MCYTAEVSFLATGALTGIGIRCWRTVRSGPTWAWPLVVIPFSFAIQQASEGCVWIGLNSNNPLLVRVAAGIYVVFAVTIWPTVFSLASALIEPMAKRRLFLYGWAVIGLLTFGKVGMQAVIGLTSAPPIIEKHSIRYPSVDEINYWGEFAGPAALRLIYLSFCTVPLIVSTWNRHFITMITVGLVASMIAIFLFDHACTSVWCLVAALNALLLSHVVHGLPNSKFGEIQKD